MRRGKGLGNLGDGEDGSELLGREGSILVPSMLSGPPGALGAGGAGPSQAGGGASGSGGELDELLYSEFDLHCNTRKSLQMVLLTQKVGTRAADRAVLHHIRCGRFNG